nr:DUF3017 domain-containing protein [Corynebacterium diphtheriae]
MSVPRLSPFDNPHDVGRKESPIPSYLQYIAVAAFVGIVVSSGIFAFTEHWRRATFALGVALLFLAVLRVVCDSKILGVLAVRSVVFDVAFSLVVGGMMVFLSYSIDSLGS